MDQDALKRQAAVRAVAEIRSGMVVGLGTGSTAKLAVDEIGRRQREDGLTITGIPTSERTAAQARDLGIPLTDFAAHDRLDLTLDGADAVRPGSLDLIKGLGGALLREKIVAAASDRLVIMVDETKLRGPFGTLCPVPVEVTPFGWQATKRRLDALGANPTLRLGGDGAPYLTDGQNLILDCAFGAIENPATLDRAIRAIVGVVETGLFVDLASLVIVAGAEGIHTLERSEDEPS